MVEISKKCKQCASEIELHKTFCNSSCAAKYNNVHRTRKKKVHYGNCDNCQKELTRSGKKFCNNKCQVEHQKKKIFLAIESGDLSINVERYKDYLIHKNGAKCMECGWNKVNQYTGKIPVQLEHVDGDSTNNTLSNLKLLCPNCHTLTPTWGNANRGNGREKRRLKRQNK